MRIVSYNIRFGGRGRTAYLGEVIRELEPDVVLLQEAFDPAAVDQVARVAEIEGVYRQPGWSVAALTREPALACAWHRPGRLRGFVELHPAGEPGLRLIGLHLPAGLSRRGERARMRHVDALVAWAGGPGESTLLVGDLNAVARGDVPRVRAMPLWLRLLLHVNGPIRTDVVDALGKAGWVDAYRRLHPDDHGFTLPAADPQVRLDYLMVPASLADRVEACAPATDVRLAPVASDHLPLVADLRPFDAG